MKFLLLLEITSLSLILHILFIAFFLQSLILQILLHISLIYYIYISKIIYIHLYSIPLLILLSSLIYSIISLFHSISILFYLQLFNFHLHIQYLALISIIFKFPYYLYNILLFIPLYIINTIYNIIISMSAIQYTISNHLWLP